MLELERNTYCVAFQKDLEKGIIIGIILAGILLHTHKNFIMMHILISVDFNECRNSYS